MSTVPIPPPYGAYAAPTPTTSGPTTQSATPVLVPEMTATITTHGRPVHVHFDATVDIRATALLGDQMSVALYCDDVLMPETTREAGYASGLVVSSKCSIITEGRSTSLAAGSHTFEARWWRTSGTGTARLVGTERRLIVAEEYGAP